MSLRVLIAGAGLGGLTLAHALRAAGLQVRLFEAGPAHLDLSASYRIHINADGSRALNACLPADLWTRFLQHSAAPPRGIEFVTEQLRHLAFVAEPDADGDPVARSHPISRSGLRQLLLSGLEEAVSFDTRVVGYQPGANGEVTVRLADGGSATADVLVGADGAASAIRKQLLPEARVVDTGVGGIAGKVLLDDPDMRERLGKRLPRQMTMVLPVRGMAFFIAPFRAPADQAERHLDMPEHLFWVLIGPREAFPMRLGAGKASQHELMHAVLARVMRWHPLVQHLVQRSAVDTLIGLPLHTSEAVPAWEPGRVTLLGDAIHTMTPLQGLGGNTALVDAALLCRQLVAADHDRVDLTRAIGTYEAEMRRYGFASVSQSLQVSNAIASTNTLGRMAFRGVLLAADRLPSLHSALFRREPMLPGRPVAA